MLDRELRILLRLSTKDTPLIFSFRKYTFLDHPSGFTTIFNDDDKKLDRLYFSKKVSTDNFLTIDITSSLCDDDFDKSWLRELSILYKLFFKHSDIIVNSINNNMNVISLGLFKKSEQQPIICEQHEEFLKKYTDWYVIKSDNCYFSEATRHLEKELAQRHIYRCHYSCDDGELYLFSRRITISTFLLALKRIDYIQKIEQSAQEYLRQQSDLFFKITKIEIPFE